MSTGSEAAWAIGSVTARELVIATASRLMPRRLEARLEAAAHKLDAGPDAAPGAACVCPFTCLDAATSGIQRQDSIRYANVANVRVIPTNTTVAFLRSLLNDVEEQVQAGVEQLIPFDMELYNITEYTAWPGADGVGQNGMTAPIAIGGNVDTLAAPAFGQVNQRVGTKFSFVLRFVMSCCIQVGTDGLLTLFNLLVAELDPLVGLLYPFSSL